MTNIPFKKMHGTGNQILVLDNRQSHAPIPREQQLRMLADPDHGFGFDQLMWLDASKHGSALASYRVFNADGSEAEQCGNGLRCIAWVLGRSCDSPFTLQSPVGLVDARIVGDQRVAVSMGAPVFAPADIPFLADKEQRSYTLNVDGTQHAIAALSLGNPHCVLDVASVDAAPVRSLGAKIEHHARFPDRVNVGFRERISRKEIRLRVFERGVGETRACGTGACAAVVSGVQNGQLDAEVFVALPGGELMVSWHGKDVWLTGDVALETEGSIDL